MLRNNKRKDLADLCKRWVLAKDNHEENDTTDEGIGIWGHPSFMEMVPPPALVAHVDVTVTFGVCDVLGKTIVMSHCVCVPCK